MQSSLAFFSPGDPLETALFRALDDGGIVDARGEFHETPPDAKGTPESGQSQGEEIAATPPVQPAKDYAIETLIQAAVKRAMCSFDPVQAD